MNDREDMGRWETYVRSLSWRLRRRYAPLQKQKYIRTAVVFMPCAHTAWLSLGSVPIVFCAKSVSNLTAHGALLEKTAVLELVQLRRVLAGVDVLERGYVARVISAFVSAR